jgi:hypothetical protein
VRSYLHGHRVNIRPSVTYAYVIGQYLYGGGNRPCESWNTITVVKSKYNVEVGVANSSAAALSVYAGSPTSSTAHISVSIKGRQIASSSVKLTAGRFRTVTLRIPRIARRLLHTRGRVRATMTSTIMVHGRRHTTVTQVTIKHR